MEIESVSSARTKPLSHLSSSHDHIFLKKFMNEVLHN